MWKTSFKSPATTTGLSFETINSGRSQQVQQGIAFPIMISESLQYSRLFNKIYKTQQKSFNLLKEDQEKQYINKIKDTISDKLIQEQRQKSFRKKFGKSAPSSARKIIKNNKINLLGFTKQQQNNSQLINFLMDHKKALQLQEEARLVEYFLRDQEKKKTKIDYINKVQLTDKHRRTQSSCKDRSQKLFKVNNEKQYQLLRKTAYIINDKLMSTSLACAKKNPTYCRMKNFSQIQYILNQDHQNVMINKQIPASQIKQQLYNIKRRIFVNLAVASEALLTFYQYIRQKDFNKLIEIILPENENEQLLIKVTPVYLNQLISKVTKYKQNKVIHFQDFIEIIQTMKEQRSYDIISRLTQKFKASELNIVSSSNQFSMPISISSLIISTMNFKFKKLFKIEVDQFIEKNRGQINDLISTYKMQVIAKKIYSSNSTKIVGKEYLPIRQIIQFMKAINIVPKTITMSKLMFFSYWYQRRVEGYNIPEFINIQVALGFELQPSLAGVQNYFAMFDVKEILCT